MMEVKDLVSMCEISKDNHVIVGGAARDIYLGKVPSTDYDIACRTEADFEYLVEILKEYDSIPDVTKTRWRFNIEETQVDVLTNTGSDREIFDSFDFNVCCFSFDGDDLNYTSEALEDLESMELNVTKKFNGHRSSALKHAMKYVTEKGYTLTDASISILTGYSTPDTIVGEEFDTYGVLKEPNKTGAYYANLYGRMGKQGPWGEWVVDKAAGDFDRLVRYQQGDVEVPKPLDRLEVRDAPRHDIFVQEMAGINNQNLARVQEQNRGRLENLRAGLNRVGQRLNPF